jgi:hypothetical protein
MRSAIWAVLLFGVGCGGATASPDEPPPTPPTADALVGEWKSEYITAGAVYRSSRMWFEEDGALRIQTVDMHSFNEPPNRGEYAGDYEVTGRGTVVYRWGGAEAEQSLSIVSGRVLDAPHPCCLRSYGGRLWTHLGYLAQDPERKRFHSTSSLRQRRAGEDTDRTQSTRVDIAFSQSPLSMRPGDACAIDLSVVVEASGPEGSDSRSVDLALPCALSEDTSGVVVLVVPGYESADGLSVIENPYISPRAWAALLLDQAPTDGWPEQLRELVGRSFRPYLVIDRERPDVLFTYVNPMSLVPEGYVWVSPQP